MTNLERYLVDKWEFSPEWLIHFPTSLYYIFFSIKSGHPLFFTNVSHDYKDSDISNSGKMKVYNQLPREYYPNTIFVKIGDIKDNLESILLEFPVIVKPNIGKRGFSAALLKDRSELCKYTERSKVDFLIQEYIDYPNECGIFYIKYPNDQKGRITSIGLKKLKTIKGDGKSTIEQLLERFNSSGGSVLHHYDITTTVLESEEELVIEPIGSHNRGTEVRSGDHLITDELLNIIEQALGELSLYYGRLDIKYKTWQELLKGDFKIIEVNTITSEPLSIYDPSFGLIKKYKTIYRHLSYLQSISTQLRKQGHKRLSIKSFFAYIQSYKNHLKLISPNS